MTPVFAEVWQELLVSALSASVALGWATTRRRLRARRIEKRFPVGGNYLTYYDDEVDGRETVVAVATLAQKGSAISGETKDVLTDREWTINGFVEGGYLSGVYSHTSPHDPGRGTFFLEQQPSTRGTYQGVWAGFDSVNRRVMSGKYVWRHVGEVALRTLTDVGSAFDHALAILGWSLGDRYIDREGLKGFVGSSSECIAVTAAVGREIVGVHLSEVMQPDDVTRLEDQVRAAGTPNNLDCHRVGLLKSLAVKTNARGRGVGTWLTLNSIDYFKSHGCTLVAALSWESGSEQSSRRMLEACGFEQMALMPDYWKQESIDKGYECPVCGVPCTCSATLLVKPL